MSFSRRRKGRGKSERGVRRREGRGREGGEKPGSLSRPASSEAAAAAATVSAVVEINDLRPFLTRTTTTANQTAITVIRWSKWGNFVLKETL